MVWQTIFVCSGKNGFTLDIRPRAIGAPHGAGKNSKQGIELAFARIENFQSLEQKREAEIIYGFIEIITHKITEPIQALGNHASAATPDTAYGNR